MVEPCKTLETHPEKIAIARQNIEENKPWLLADLFKILSGETRIKILLALTEDELCVCDLAEVLNMSVSAISHQLKELRRGRFVNYRREGKEVYYSLETEHLDPIIQQALEHLGHI